MTDIIVGLSAFGAGLSLYLSYRDAQRAKATVGRKRRAATCWALARLGFAIIVPLVAEAVFKAEALPWTWRLGLYTFGLLLCFVGFFGIALWDDRYARHEQR